MTMPAIAPPLRPLEDPLLDASGLDEAEADEAVGDGELLAVVEDVRGATVLEEAEELVVEAAAEVLDKVADSTNPTMLGPGKVSFVGFSQSGLSSASVPQQA